MLLLNSHTEGSLNEIKDANSDGLLKRSCDYCVRYKRRCDGARPFCSQCSRTRKSEIPCSYSVRKKPGRKIRTQTQDREKSASQTAVETVSIKKEGAENVDRCNQPPLKKQRNNEHIIKLGNNAGSTIHQNRVLHMQNPGRFTLPRPSPSPIELLGYPFLHQYTTLYRIPQYTSPSLIPSLIETPVALWPNEYLRLAVADSMSGLPYLGSAGSSTALNIRSHSVVQSHIQSTPPPTLSPPLDNNNAGIKVQAQQIALNVGIEQKNRQQISTDCVHNLGIATEANRNHSMEQSAKASVITQTDEQLSTILNTSKEKCPGKVINITDDAPKNRSLYRNSCDNCVKSKRKCDGGRPSCGECRKSKSVKKVCHYAVRRKPGPKTKPLSGLVDVAKQLLELSKQSAVRII